MKYLEQEPLVARTKRHSPQPVPHTAGLREVRWGERQDGQDVQSVAPLRPSEHILPFRKKGAGIPSSPSWCPQSTQCGDLWVTDMKQRAGDMERRAGEKWGPSIIFRLSVCHLHTYPLVGWGLAIRHNYRITRAVSLQSQCEET